VARTDTPQAIQSPHRTRSIAAPCGIQSIRRILGVVISREDCFKSQVSEPFADVGPIWLGTDADRRTQRIGPALILLVEFRTAQPLIRGLGGELPQLIDQVFYFHHVPTSDT